MTRDQLAAIINTQARWLAGIDQNRRRRALDAILDAADQYKATPSPKPARGKTPGEPRAVG